MVAASAETISAIAGVAAVVLVPVGFLIDHRRRRRERERQEQRERERQAERERAQAERERDQASRILASAYGYVGPEYLIRVENRSDAPITELFAALEPRYPGEAVREGTRVLGRLGPGEEAKPSVPVRRPPPDDATRASVELVFTDADGRRWRRQGGALERGVVELDEKTEGRVARWRARP